MDEHDQRAGIRRCRPDRAPAQTRWSAKSPDGISHQVLQYEDIGTWFAACERYVDPPVKLADVDDAPVTCLRCLVAA